MTLTAPQAHLLTALSVAVPLEIDRLRDQPDWALDDLRTVLAGQVQLNADSMQFGDGKPGAVAAGFVAQARALALLALQAEGGVDFCGAHWCAIPYCRAATRYDHAVDDGLPAIPEPRAGSDDQPQRTISTVPVGEQLADAPQQPTA